MTKKNLKLLRLRASAKAKAERERLSSDDSLQIMEQQSPLVSDIERIKLMALGSPQGRLSTLRRKLGDRADVVLAEGNVPASSGKGRILIREKDSPTGYWYPLDPQGESNQVEATPMGAPAGLGQTQVADSSETLKDLIEGIPDVLSVGSDTAASLFMGPAQKSVGLLQKVARGPLKSAAIGGLIPATVEGLRQGAGSVLGISDNIDPGEIGLAAASGGLGGLLFGAGNAEGLGGMAVRKLYKRAAARATGLPEKAIEALKEYLPEIERFEKRTGAEQLSDVEAMRKAAANRIQDVRQKTGGLLQGEFRKIDEAYPGGAIETDYVLEPLSQERARIATEGLRDKSGELVPASKRQLETIDLIENDLFGIDPKPKMTAMEAANTRQNLKDPSGAFSSRPHGKQPADEQLFQEAVSEARKRLRERLSVLSEGRTEPLFNQYGDTVDAINFLDEVFPRKTTGADKLARAASSNFDYSKLEKIDKSIGTNLGERAQFFDLLDNFRKDQAPFARPKWREVALPLAGGAAGAGVSYATQGEIPYWQTVPLGLLGAYLTGTRGGIRSMTKHGPRIIEPAASQILRGGLWNAMMGGPEREGKERR